jgi:hypothetical protein
MILQDGESISNNWFFKTPEDCLIGACEVCFRLDRPFLRLFEWFPGHMAYTVDGLLDVEVIIVETVAGSGEWRMRRNGVWADGVWSSPIEALTL